MRTRVFGLFIGLAATVVACGGSSTGSSSNPVTAAEIANDGPRSVAPAIAQEIPGGIPAQLIASPNDGEPALFLSASPDAASLGYVAGHVALRVTGPIGERTPVEIDGPLAVRGLYLDSQRLAARVLRGGRVRGTPTSVAPHNVVRVIGPGDEPRRTRIEVAPSMSADGPPVGRWVGTFPTIGLGAEVPTQARGPAPGTPMAAGSGVPVTLFDSPGGQPVVTLPGTAQGVTVAVVRDGAEWRGVRAGVGPFVIGWTNVSLVAAPPVDAGIRARTPSPDQPARIREEANRPLFRVAAGTQIAFDGRVIAELRETGWAREMQRYEAQGLVDAFVAVNDDVAVRGLVPLSALSAP